MCHMIADTDRELHTMAKRIGVQRKWFQHPKTNPHYDICLSKRRLALQFGAVEIEWRTYGKMCRHRQKYGLLGTPDMFEDQS